MAFDIKAALAAAKEKLSTFLARTKQTFDEAFEHVRLGFGGMQCRYSIREDESTASVCRMEIRVGKKWVDLGGMRMFVELLIHEFNHPYLAPGGIADHIKYAKLACKKMGLDVKTAGGFVSSLLNLVYDIIVDTDNQDKRKGDIQYQTECLYENFGQARQKDYSDPKAKTAGVLLSYTEAIVGTPFTGCTFPDDVAAAAHGAVAIVRSRQTLHNKIDAILDLMIPFYTGQETEKDEEDGDGQPGGKGKGKGKKGKGQPELTAEQLEALSDQIKQAMKDAQKGQSSVSEQMGEDPEGAVMAAIDPNDKDAVAIAGGFMGYGPEMMDKAICKAKARRLLQQLALKGKKPGMPNGNRVGHVGWNPSLPVADLDVRASVMTGGPKLIPGITTKKNFVYETPGVEKSSKLERIALSVDVSGSMNKDDTILGIYAVLLWAQKHGMKACIDMWSNVEKFFPWSYDVADHLDKLWAKYGCTGGGTSASGLKKLEGQLTKGDVLFYITDFATSHQGQEEAKLLLSQFKAQGVRVVFIAMFDHHVAAASGHQFYECPTIQDLPKLALKIMEDIN